MLKQDFAHAEQQIRHTWNAVREYERIVYHGPNALVCCVNILNPASLRRKMPGPQSSVTNAQKVSNAT